MVSGYIELHAAGKPVDTVTVFDWLRNHQATAEVGGPGYLVELWDAAPSAINAVRYAQIVRGLAIPRDIGHLARELLASAAKPYGPGDELLADAVAKFLDLAERRAKNDLVSAFDAHRAALTSLDERTETGSGGRAVPTGLKHLDELTGGLGDGELIVIAGRTSQGKTALALQIAYHAGLELVLPTLVFSLEQGHLEIGHRNNSIRTGVDSYKFRRPEHLTGYDATLLVESGEFFLGKPLHISDTRNQSPDEVASIARAHKHKHGLRLMIVDYIQLMKFARPGFTPRREQVGTITRDLKTLARELQCPVVAMAQLNRQVENRADRKPQLSDLRESGSIEQDADSVLLLQPPDEEKVKEKPELNGTLEIHVAKQRNGPTGSVTVHFDKATGRITDFCWDNVAPRSFSGGGGGQQ